jgi:hypothetical protein
VHSLKPETFALLWAEHLGFKSEAKRRILAELNPVMTELLELLEQELEAQSLSLKSVPSRKAQHQATIKG